MGETKWVQLDAVGDVLAAVYRVQSCAEAHPGASFYCSRPHEVLTHYECTLCGCMVAPNDRASFAHRAFHLSLPVPGIDDLLDGKD